MPRRRRILVFGLTLFMGGLIWTGWAISTGLEEMNLPAAARTETLGGLAMSLVVSGIVIMIASRFAREDT